MTRVTTHYCMSSPVPFLDVHVGMDNELFLDPSAIRNNRGVDPLAHRAHDLLLRFFQEVLRCRRSPHRADQAKGLALLQRLHEPNETRLGMSVDCVSGHGFGDELGQRLWDELQRNAACRAAAVTRLEDLALFVDRVGDDLVSDLTTRVIFEVLADFTQQMMARFPSLAAGQTTETGEVWDPGRREWTTRTLTLPYVAPHQLLLVPKRWVFWRMLMDPDAFYNHFGTDTVQQERTTHTSDGKKLAPSKRSLKEEFPHVKGLNNQQAAKYMTDGVDLVARYRRQVDQAYEPLGDAELERRTPE